MMCEFEGEKNGSSGLGIELYGTLNA